MKKTFYICSYGGCGSMMLFEALSKFGFVKHIHSRNPPEKLQYINYREWFSGINIPDSDIENYCVIYIYRNPSYSIPSRFTIPQHLENIQIDKSITLQDVLNTGNDLYKIREFYDNYTKINEKRNYKIYSVKYEEIFDKQDELSEILGVGKLNLINISERKETNKKLDEIYKDLIDIMKKNNFIMIN